MRFHKYITTFIILLLVFSLAIAGCTPAKRPIVERDKTYYTPAPTKRTVPLKPVPRTTPINTRQGTEDTLARAIEKISGVKNASVLVNNNVAYVGVDLTSNIENVQTDSLKNQIINKVKSMEPTITTVYVSADVDVVGRLRNYIKDVRAGKPVSGFINELEEMFRRPIPRT